MNLNLVERRIIFYAELVAVGRTVRLSRSVNSPRGEYFVIIIVSARTRRKNSPLVRKRVVLLSLHRQRRSADICFCDSSIRVQKNSVKHRRRW